MDDMHFSFKIENPPAWLPIGRTAENDWRTIEIDCSCWFNMDATGNVVLMYRPSCGMAAYPLLIERDGDNIVWHPKSGELVEGVGQMQAFFYVGESKIGSSKMISCEVDSSLLGVEPGTDPGQTDLPWALDIIEQIAELSGHYPKIIDGVLYIWDSALNDWVEFEASGGGAVESVNGMTGAVVLGASDVHALPETYVAPVQSVNGQTGAVTIPTGNPDAVLYTEQTLPPAQKAQARENIGAGTYSKPSGGIPDSDIASAATWNAKYTKPASGIPASDLASGVIPTVPQMATAADMSDWTSDKTVDAAVLKNGVQYIERMIAGKANTSDIPTAVSELTNDSGYQTATQVQTAIAGKADKTQRVAMTSADNTPTLNPNTFYVFPEMASLAPTLATPTGATIVNEYHFMFTSGATATTLTIPATINQPDGFTVEANHVYEVSILEGCMTAQGWAVS